MLHPNSGCFLIFQVNTRERYGEDGNISLKKSLLLEEKGKQKEAEVCWKSCSKLSVGLYILMPGDSGLPSPDTTASKGYVTRILLSAVFEG
jgi:hypothetical protein